MRIKHKRLMRVMKKTSKKQKVRFDLTRLFIMIWLIGFSLSTATFAESMWKFVIVGDSRDNESGVNTAILSEIAAEIVSQEAEFVLFPGDLVVGYTNQVLLESQLMIWRNTMQSVYDAGIAVYPVRGNHDIGNPAGRIAWDTIFSGEYALPTNGPGAEFGLTYSVSHKNVFVLALDQYVNPHKVNQLWVDEQLSVNTKPHIVAFGHEPAFKLHHPDCLDDYPVERDAFWASLKKAGCMIYACGHDHFYDRAVVDDGDGNPDNDISQYVVGTAGAPIYSWSPPYDGDNSGMKITQSCHSESHGYILAEVTDSQITTTWYEKNGETGKYEPSVALPDPNEPTFRFGVLADIQYGDFDAKPSRYYRKSLGKLQECVDQFNSSKLLFTIQLGDFIESDQASYPLVFSIYNQLKMSRYHVLGNHDFAVEDVSADKISSTFGLKKDYYDFAHDGWRFIVLNSNDISTYANPPGSEKDLFAEQMFEKFKSTGAVNTHEWNGDLSETQKKWLTETLADASCSSEKVVIFCHQPVYPVNAHNVWSDTEVIRIIESYDCVVAYINGHNHQGNYGIKDGVHYLTLHGMVETESTNAYAIIEVYEDHLKVVGYGREPSRVLLIDPSKE